SFDEQLGYLSAPANFILHRIADWNQHDVAAAHAVRLAFDRFEPASNGFGGGMWVAAVHSITEQLAQHVDACVELVGVLHRVHRNRSLADHRLVVARSPLRILVASSSTMVLRD